jgi:hypothetical protein
LIRNAFIRIASPLPAAVLLACTFGTLHAPLSAQTATPETPFTRQIHRLDLGITGVGLYNTTVHGPIVPAQATDAGTVVTQFGSNTAGAVVSLRYVAKPYVGFEFNYGYARYTENYNVAPYQIQSKVNEYTLGYVATPDHQFFGLQPYLGGGAGTTAFNPTPHGGQGAPEKARMTYYYSVGFQKSLGEGHFGLRAGFRQLFFLDPDFGQNYLTILKHASTYEPQAGFYLRY